MIIIIQKKIIIIKKVNRLQLSVLPIPGPHGMRLPNETEPIVRPGRRRVHEENDSHLIEAIDYTVTDSNLIEAIGYTAAGERDNAAASDYEYFVPPTKVAFFQQNGYVVLENVISPNEVKRYVDLLQQMLDGEISTKDKRGDLGGHVERVDQTKENTVQIMHPKFSHPSLMDASTFERGEDIANQLYYNGTGRRENWGLDCSQFLVKFPKTMTETPWHQDQSYYPPGLVDMDASMQRLACAGGLYRRQWLPPFIPTPLSCNELSPHRAAGNGRGALMTDPPEEGLERRATTPMRAGSVVAFNNYTYHYGGPNITEKEASICSTISPQKDDPSLQSSVGFDHGKFTSNEDGALRTVNAAASKKRRGLYGGAD